MIKKVKFLFMQTVILFLFSENLFAADAGHGNPMMDLALKGVNFVILIGLLYIFVRKPVASILNSILEGNREALVEAREQAQKADLKIKEYQARMDNMEQEMAEFKNQSLLDTEAEKTQIIKTAEEKAQRILEQAEAQVALKLDHARAEIRELLVKEAMQIAEQQLAADVSVKEKQALVDKFTHSLKEVQ